MNNINNICRLCGSETRRRVFCSDKCSRKYWRDLYNSQRKPKQQTKRDCRVCKKSFIGRQKDTTICSEKCKELYAIERSTKWYFNNKEQKQAYDKEYASQNREKRRLASKKNREKHPKRKRADTALRRAQRINATPKWVDRQALKQIYENCPDGCHVDHIIPLKGKDVCGLHVPWNLQYLNVEDNLRKSNHYSFGEGK